MKIGTVSVKCAGTKKPTSLKGEQEIETLYHWETTNRLEKIEKNLDRLFKLSDKIHNLSGGNTMQPRVTALKKLESTGDQLDQLIDEIEVGFPASCTTESIIEKLKVIKAGLYDPV